ncbi:hypothetical protein DFH11DRAFT_422118 [Phellopilus nigrolimitatus]|nr:hypothetical protein DFH11DRAFT_422118 [Phellopilus nigrolimitatus]
MSDQLQDLLSPDVSGAALLALPARLWHLYVACLWDAQRGSWVARVASTFRILAILVIFPFVVLSLLDVMSYIIARTLGVVETTKASTSDKRTSEVYVDNDEPLPQSGTEHVDRQLPVPVHVTPASGGTGYPHEAEARSGDVKGIRAGEEDQVLDTGRPAPSPPPVRSGEKSNARFNATLALPIAQAPGQGLEPAACFFSPSDEKNLELSGANLSSPTVSRQGSPSIERRRLQPLRGDHDHDTSASSSDTESSFTLLEREPELLRSDTSGILSSGAVANLRRRETVLGLGADDS